MLIIIIYINNINYILYIYLPYFEPIDVNVILNVLKRAKKTVHYFCEVQKPGLKLAGLHDMKGYSWTVYAALI